MKDRIDHIVTFAPRYQKCIWVAGKGKGKGKVKGKGKGKGKVKGKGKALP